MIWIHMTYLSPSTPWWWPQDSFYYSIDHQNYLKTSNCSHVSNICLNMFNLNCPENYSLHQYCSIFIGSHNQVTWRQTHLYFILTSDTSRLTTKKCFPPSQSLRHDVWGCSFNFPFSSHHLLVGRWVKVRDLLPVAFGTCCSLAASLCFDPFTSQKMLIYAMCNICLSVLISLCNYAICMCTA